MSNLNSYTQELSTVFPKTLSDAIKVCREIGMRYIWIDALCIVQDDPKDKAREIGQMGRIYKDATLTIMAASAKSVYEGFLDDAKIDAPEPSSLSTSTRTPLAPSSSEALSPVIPVSWMKSPSLTGPGHSKRCCYLPRSSCSIPIRQR